MNTVIDPQDLVVLSILTSVHSRPAPLAAVARVVQAIAPGDWMPTGDVLAAGARRLIEDGGLQILEESDSASDAEFVATDAGRRTLATLLCKPVGGPTACVRRASAAFKLGWLDCLSNPFDRIRQVDQLSDTYRHDLMLLRSRRRQADRVRCPASVWLDHEIERTEWELRWLDRFRQPRPSPRAEPR